MIKLTQIFTIICIFLFFAIPLHAQINADALVGIPRYTTTEINSVSNVNEGSLVYDSTLKRVLEFTDSGWKEILVKGSTHTIGHFVISSGGSITIDNLPFTPSAIKLIAYSNVESVNVNADNQIANNARGIANSFGSMTGYARQNSDNSITQQVIYIGSHGNSINDISKFASSNHCIGLRFGDQNGNNLGIIRAALTTFGTNSFTLSVEYINGTVNSPNTSATLNVEPNDVLNESIVVLYEAYR